MRNGCAAFSGGLDTSAEASGAACSVPKRLGEGGSRVLKRSIGDRISDVVIASGQSSGKPAASGTVETMSIGVSEVPGVQREAGHGVLRT